MFGRFCSVYWRTKYVKAEKCEFHVLSISFLGYIISQGQIEMDPAKVSVVAEFLGFANFYRRLIRGYSQVAAPLTALTSTKSAFIWTPKAETAFLDLKKGFVSAPILVQPDPSLQFVVEADASDTGVGAILSQRSPSDHKLHPCAFFSRRLSSLPWRSGGIGWRVRSIHLLSGPTTTTWPISSLLKD